MRLQPPPVYITQELQEINGGAITDPTKLVDGLVGAVILLVRNSIEGL